METYLALGDSYTIGEGVPLYESFPYQTVQLLRKSGISFHAPEIIAKTGWTTDELMAGIAATKLLPAYDRVTLLIGVNNQYRGRSVHEYQHEFEVLLKQAIAFAGSKAQHVIALSIPDWGVTPFAADRDTAKIAQEIDAYNAVNKKLSLQYKVNYIDITPGTRSSANDESFLAADKLHPSGKEYARWAEQVYKILSSL
ncbi:MAG TPA: SGNH/GDSL hydrolase family protein [Chitinophagaceae bacterium]|nr:SGNH/GDSL hydrolase family protein [Chitinophagaceae bacterium]